MKTKIQIDELSNTVIKALEEYANLTNTEMKKAVKDVAALARKEIKTNAPKDTGQYQKSWSSKVVKETSETMNVVVYSRNRYQLAHLLEFGHAKRGGGRVSGKVHIAPAEAKAINQLEHDIINALKD